jgi:transposase InsO family protein
MGQVLHGCARTTAAVVLNGLAEQYGINPKTVAKWKKRSFANDAPMGPKEVRSTVLTQEEEAAIVAFRKYTLLSLDDCLYALQPSIPHLTPSLHRCLQRHGAEAYWTIPFDRLCDALGIGHRLTKVNHPWTNGQVERMNRTIKDATVKRYYYSHTII